MTTFQKLQLRTVSAANASTSIKPLSLNELVNSLRSMAPGVMENSFDTDPRELTADEFASYEQKVAHVLELMNGIKPKNKYKFTQDKKRFQKQRKRVLAAFEVLQNMSFKEQDHFASHYTEVFDDVIGSLVLEDYQKFDAGLIPGVTYELLVNGERNPLLVILDTPKYYAEDVEVIEMALLLCSLVQVEESDTTTEGTKKKAFQEAVKGILNNHNRTEGLTKVIEEEVPETDYKLFIWQMLKLLKNARDSGGNVNTRAITAGMKFIGRGGFSKELILEHISLADFQRNKSDGGHVYGLQFDDSDVSIYADLKDGYKDHAKENGLENESGIDGAFIRVKGESIPILGMDYITSNMSAHFDAGAFTKVELVMTWDTKKTSDDVGGRKEPIQANIDLNNANLTLDNVLYRSRFLSKKRKEDGTLIENEMTEEQYSVLMGNITIENLSMKNLTITDELRKFKNNSEVIYRLTEGIQDQLYLLIDVILSMVSQTSLTPMDIKDFESFNNSAKRTILGADGVELKIGKGMIRNFVDSEGKVLGNVPLDGLTIKLNSQKAEAEDFDVELWKQQQELKALEEDLAELYKKKARFIKNHEGDFISKSKYINEFDETRKKSTIGKLIGEIDSLNNEISEKINSPITYTLSSNDPLGFSRAFYIDEMLRKTFQEKLGLFGLYDIQGLNEFTLTQGIEMNGSIGLDRISDTVLKIDEIAVPKLFDSAVHMDLGALRINGNDVNLSNLKGAISLKWSEVAPTGRGEVKSELRPIKIALTGGDMTVKDLELVDTTNKKPSFKIGGMVTLENTQMIFHSVGDFEGENNYKDIEFSCTSIVLDNVAQYQHALKDNPEIENWFVAQDGGTIRLSGINVRNKKSNALGINAAGNSVTSQELEVKATSGAFDNLLVDGFSINSNITKLRAVITNETETTPDNQVIRSTMKTELYFGLSELFVPDLTREMEGISLSHIPYDSDDIKKKIKRMKNQLNVYKSQLAIEKEDFENSGNVVTKSYNQFQIDYYQDRIQKLTRQIQREELTTGKFEGNFLTGIDGKVTIILEASGDKEEKEIKSVVVDYFDTDKVQTQNLRVKNTQTGKEIDFIGLTTIEGFGAKNIGMTRNDVDDKLSFDLLANGSVFGGATAIGFVSSELFKLDDVSASSWYIKKMKDVQGYSYNFEDLKAMYEITPDGGLIEGGLDLSADGSIIINNEKEFAYITVNTDDLINVPLIETDGFSIKGNSDSIGLHGLHLTAKLKYHTSKVGEETKYHMDYVTITKLNIGRINLSGTQIHLDETFEMGIAQDDTLWLENVTLKNLTYDFRTKGFNSFEGSLTSDEFNLELMQNFSTLNKKNKSVLTLLQGGMSGDSLSFERGSNGKIDVEITSPDMLFNFLKVPGLMLKAENFSKNVMGEDLEPLKILSAGTVTYSSQNEHGTEGHFLKVSGAEFHGVPISGFFQSPIGGMNINEFILSGKVNEDLIINYIDGKYVEIKADGADITVENIDLYMSDTRKMKPKKKIDRKEPRVEDSNKDGTIDDMENAQHIARLVEYHENVYNRKRSHKAQENRPQAIEQARKKLGFSESYLNKILDAYNTAMILQQRGVPIDKNGQKLLNDYNKFADELYKITAGRISDDFNFLDHMTSGYVSISLFNERAFLPIVRVNPEKQKMVTTWPVDKDWEKDDGGGFSTFVDLGTFIHRLTVIFDNNIDEMSWLANAVSEDEMFTEETANLSANDLALYTDVVIDNYLVTLVADLNRYNNITFNDRQYVRLSSVIDTIMYNQAADSMMRFQPPDDTFQALTDRMDQYFVQLLHDEMNPSFSLTNVKVDLKDKNDIDKGLLGFITSQEDSLRFNMRIDLNQQVLREITIDEEQHFVRALGPQLRLYNFNLPKFEHSKRSKTGGKTLIKGNGITIEELKVGKSYMRVVPASVDRGRNRNDAGDDHSGWLTGKNVNIKDFEIKLPLKAKRQRVHHNKAKTK